MEVADYSSLVRNLLKHLLSYLLLKVQQKQHCDFLVTTNPDKFKGGRKENFYKE